MTCQWTKSWILSHKSISNVPLRQVYIYSVSNSQEIAEAVSWDRL